jgi:hypothetical protein
MAVSRAFTLLVKCLLLLWKPQLVSSLLGLLMKLLRRHFSLSLTFPEGCSNLQKAVCSSGCAVALQLASACCSLLLLGCLQELQLDTESKCAEWLSSVWQQL